MGPGQTCAFRRIPTIATSFARFHKAPEEVFPVLKLHYKGSSSCLDNFGKFGETSEGAFPVFQLDTQAVKLTLGQLQSK